MYEAKVNVYRFIRNKNEDNLTHNALHYFDKLFTYQKFFNQIDLCAAHLWNLGIRKGDIVTIQSLHMPQIVMLFYAIGKIGAIANILYVTSSGKDTAASIEETNSKMFIAMDAVFDKVKADVLKTSVDNIVLLSLGEEADFVTKTVLKFKFKKKNYDDSRIIRWASFLKKCDLQPEEVNDGSCPVAMIYTSGTTGKSKAVVLTSEAMNALSLQYEHSEFNMARGDSFFNSLPPFIAFGLVTGMHVPFGLGLVEVLIADPTASGIGAKYAKYKPNAFVNGVAAVENILENAKVNNQDLSYVKVFAVGGDKIPVAFEERVNSFLKSHNSNAHLSIGYGLTEVAATVITAGPNAYRIGTVGLPLPATNVKIVEYQTENELGYEEEGEVCITAPTLMAGYYKNQEATDDMIRKHADGYKWVHTGDRGKIDKDGFVYIVGRYKRMMNVIRDGVYHKVFPQNIEESFLNNTSITEIGIVGISNVERGNDLIAYVVTDESCDWDSTVTALTNYSEKNFESWERPVEYRKIDKLPRTQIGKVDFRKLEEITSQYSSMS